MNKRRLARSLGRIRSAVLLLMLVLSLFAQPAGAVVSHVVLNWTSPTWGFSIDYRRDTFQLENESSFGGIDELTLRSHSSVLTIEALPFDFSINDCVQEALNDTVSGAINYLMISPVQNGSAMVAAGWPNLDGELVDATHRIDCIASSDGDYLVRFIHRAHTNQYGLLEAAARSVRESYRPGYPADSPLPADFIYPDGLVEVTLLEVYPDVEPPADSNLVNHPTRFFVAEIKFDSITESTAIINVNRLMIDGNAIALKWEWVVNGSTYQWDAIELPNGAESTGRFLFAVPQSQSSVAFCYRHATDNDCAFLFDYSFQESAQQTSPDDEVEGGGPGSGPRINPGR